MFLECAIMIRGSPRTWREFHLWGKNHVEVKFFWNIKAAARFWRHSRAIEFGFTKMCDVRKSISWVSPWRRFGGSMVYFFYMNQMAFFRWEFCQKQQDFLPFDWITLTSLSPWTEFAWRIISDSDSSYVILIDLSITGVIWLALLLVCLNIKYREGLGAIIVFLWEFLK